MGFEFSEMASLRANLIEFNRKTDAIHLKVANRVALLAIRKVKQMTPVDKGLLRSAWKHRVTKTGDSYSILVYNETEYSSFVEAGHRIVSQGRTVGWVEGRFMLKLTKEEMDRIAPIMWKDDVEKEMRRIFGN